MTANVLPILLSLLILVCPFNCMPEIDAGTDATAHSCCSHCQSKSEQAPLAPSPESDCCQCLCSGAIQEQTAQLDDDTTSAYWITLPLISLSSPTFIDEQTIFAIPAEPVPLYGRTLRCQQMSFQC
ncbi:hypothetical protein [Gimesia maris]|uniref:Secreted protein n=1 Tax=Gimesia maris TaxID=122 RepID=A0ABX5YPF1_9PLAN|nr:hypothetical protein [Gimesia maris]EDL58421.1 hypothetical protein PM8797T_27235 [Gimesia maris DSM 8797]QEG17488.1 hypothetical protein GmarT_33690 [Gimesia maris]QGQ29444.1 hypothetical protein F1729_12685 [Gimesia maris]